jgi:hypothetical protein
MNELPWKDRLRMVHALLKRFNRNSVAVRLFDNVASNLHETLEDLEKLETGDNGDWEEIVDIFGDSEEYYMDKAETLSILTGAMSPFHLFDAVADGLRFNGDEVKRLKGSDARERWLQGILGGIGQRIENLLIKPDPAYFDTAIGRGSGKLFVEIAGALQGVSGGGGMVSRGSRRRVGAYDWRDVLQDVLQKVREIQRPEDMMIGYVYDQVLSKLEGTITRLRKIPDDSLEDEKTWDRVYTELEERLVSFKTLDSIPKIKRLFRALSSGLSIIGKRERWGRLKDPKPVVMEKVLKSIGRKLKDLDPGYYDEFLPEGSGMIMGQVADILIGKY